MGMVEQVRLVFRLPEERASEESRYLESEELHDAPEEQTD